jgi:hypothetical protein
MSKKVLGYLLMVENFYLNLLYPSMQFRLFGVDIDGYDMNDKKEKQKCASYK